MISCARSEQEMRGTGEEEVGKQKVRKRTHFCSEGEVANMFEEKLDTADFCLIFEWIEDRGGEMRILETRERKVLAF